MGLPRTKLGHRMDVLTQGVMFYTGFSALILLLLLLLLLETYCLSSLPGEGKSKFTLYLDNTTCRKIMGRED
jgi:hypothetical protein